MKIIVGLGNPDKEYENTFHNLGFMCLDKAVERLNLTFNKNKFKAKILECNIKGEKVLFVKPQTYMNLSGESVGEVLSFYKADQTDLLVVYDDFDLYKGSIRIRENGSAGTHNGMKNIIERLGNGNFPRIRVGFKPTEQNQIPLINLVLSGISSQDRELFDKTIDTVSQAIIDFCGGLDIQSLMKKYNVTQEKVK